MAESELLQLAALISQSVATLIKTCAENSLALPRLSDPFTPESDAFRAIPACEKAANIIASATAQLAAVVAPPQLRIMNMAGGYLHSSALWVCLESSVTEVLREAGPQGLHVDEIAAKCSIDSGRLGRLMRLICNHHVYREVSPDVFANNRVSSTLDTGKSITDIQKDPESKHDGTQGFAALVEHRLSGGQKASACLMENMRDPLTAFSSEPNQAPFNRAYGIDIPMWAWHQLPEQSYSRRRFNVAMQGMTKLQPSDVLTTAFDWASLPDGALVVDVGGGIGAPSLPLARAFTGLKVIIQDEAEVTEQGKKHWSKNYPEAIQSGRVQFQPHDFFTAQPVKNASVFILKHILHNWSDLYAAKILLELRRAAAPDTKLVILDIVMQYSCHDPRSGESAHTIFKEAPAPLLANFGSANDMSYTLDAAMMVWFNAQERTTGGLRKLLGSAGWRIVQAAHATKTAVPVVAAIIPGFPS
ncbi:S-adenosyl-L-methionine-dependent methyltransferase [Athelia psychrophila]|uniref:S-adenosyl-L-methionine-dependent methyltransferase n=1 Tax=Athelia psychrophila TaxID=1759441 RepID=A0A166P502_9AGAM|nr:S-adenosyl-L-methionine-dependent methyltransferase [Fibularhizoctonia sp. CBS 109695]